MTQLTHRSLADLRSLLRSGQLSAREVTEAQLSRIDRLEPAIGAFLNRMSETARARADSLDSVPEKERGALHGIPIAIKDIISVAGSPCTCGSRILEGYVPPFDATVITRLKRAGAVILGKTNMDEFAMGSSTENSAFHTTRNPWELGHVPGGSSGGSAAAVAAREVPAALGTDTGGSIRQPASLCGVVGLKPTYGRVSRFGLVAFASSLDQIGPIARSVEDAAILLEVLSGHDRRDATSADEPVPGYAERLSEDLPRLRVGVPKLSESEGVVTSVARAFASAIATLESIGAKVEPIELPNAEQACACYYLIATAEASSNLARYDGVRYGLRRSTEKSLGQMMSDTRDSGLGPEVKRRILLGTFVLSSGYYDAYYNKAQKVRNLIASDYAKALSGVDVIALPTSPTPAFPLGERVNDPLSMYLSDVFTITANLIGAPAISLPCGFSDEGLPIGLQLQGKAFDELTLLQLAHAYESATDFKDKVPALPGD